MKEEVLVLDLASLIHCTSLCCKQGHFGQLHVDKSFCNTDVEFHFDVFQSIFLFCIIYCQLSLEMYSIDLERFFLFDLLSVL